MSNQALSCTVLVLLALSLGVRAAGNLLTQHFEGNEYINWLAPGQGRVPEDCPQWIQDYIVFHKKNLGKPGTRYLVNACQNPDECTHGLGDRLRGLLPTLQLAKAYNRVLLIYWPSPAPLENYLEPHTIQWALTPDLGVDLSQAVRLDENRVNLTHPNAEGAEGARIWTLDTNRMVYRPSAAAQGLQDMKWFARVSFDAHCIFQSLFTPSDKLTKATDAVQKELLGSLSAPFVAVHLRMGNLAGEAKDILRGWDHFQGVLASYKCAVERDALLHGDAGFVPSLSDAQGTSSRSSRSSAQPSADTPRMVMLTDHSELRGMVAQGMLRGMTGPSYVAHHLSYSKDLKQSGRSKQEEITMSIFVDLMLLTRAKCLIWSKSGFPKFAMAWAWPTCTAQVEYCIQKAFPKTRPGY